MTMPRRLRTHYYRDRAESAKRKQDIAYIFEKHVREAVTLWPAEGSGLRLDNLTTG